MDQRARAKATSGDLNLARAGNIVANTVTSRAPLSTQLLSYLRRNNRHFFNPAATVIGTVQQLGTLRKNIILELNVLPVLYSRRMQAMEGVEDNIEQMMQQHEKDMCAAKAARASYVRVCCELCYLFKLCKLELEPTLSLD